MCFIETFQTPCQTDPIVGRLSADPRVVKQIQELAHPRLDFRIAKKKELCILPIGDSMTHGFDDEAGWRYLLWKKLVQSSEYTSKNLVVDFAGSMRAHSSVLAFKEKVSFSIIKAICSFKELEVIILVF